MGTLSTIRKGWLGESRVIANIISQGYNVYVPVVDDGGVDLIVEAKNKFHRVQVKSCHRLKTRTSIEVNMDKHKDTGRVDIVAAYYSPKDIFAYIPYNNQSRIVLALHTAKNNQEKHRIWFYEYMEFPV